MPGKAELAAASRLVGLATLPSNQAAWLPPQASLAPLGGQRGGGRGAQIEPWIHQGARQLGVVRKFYLKEKEGWGPQFQLGTECGPARAYLLCFRRSSRPCRIPATVKNLGGGIQTFSERGIQTFFDGGHTNFFFALKRGEFSTYTNFLHGFYRYTNFFGRSS